MTDQSATENAQAIQLHPSWLAVVGGEFELPYMRQLKQFLQEEKKQRKIIYPPGKLIFNAMNTTHFNDVKVVIIGQDPYHGPNQAHGLCFSVLPGVPIPPSLRNIYQELQSDLDIPTPNHGYLQSWAEHGVLLLNAILTVERGKPGSHQGKGWETFTDAVIRAINDERKDVVFLLWGSYAQQKGQVIDVNKHLVLKAPHPSPFSANRGFFGCKHFSKTNQYLQSQGLSPVDWRLPMTV